jgi:hypothetical protein
MFPLRGPPCLACLSRIHLAILLKSISSPSRNRTFSLVVVLRQTSQVLHE